MSSAATAPDPTNPKIEDAFNALRALAGNEVRVLYIDPDQRYVTQSIIYGVLDASSEFSDGGGHYFEVYDGGGIVGSFKIDPASLRNEKCWVREDRQIVEFFSSSVVVHVELFD